MELAVGSHLIPTVRLELRLLTEWERGRPDRLEPIVETLRVRSPDMELIRRGLIGRGAEEKYVERTTCVADSSLD